jgi:hypothetical protein
VTAEPSSRPPAPSAPPRAAQRSPLAELADSVRDCIAAAWVDTRTGAVIEHHVVRAGPEVAAALDAAAEIAHSRDRPPRIVLLSAHQVHIVQRVAADPRRAVIVICERSPNIGLAVALVRAFADAEAA